VEFDSSRKHFQESAKATATAGEEFCKTIWYELECVNFVQHEFPSKLERTIHRAQRHDGVKGADLFFYSRWLLLADSGTSDVSVGSILLHRYSSFHTGGT